jgi:hypothetical protein
MWGSCWFGIVKAAWTEMTVEVASPLTTGYVLIPRSKNTVSFLQEGFEESVTWCLCGGNKMLTETNSLLASNTVTSLTPQPWCLAQRGKLVHIWQLNAQMNNIYKLTYFFWVSSSLSCFSIGTEFLHLPLWCLGFCNISVNIESSWIFILHTVTQIVFKPGCLTDVIHYSGLSFDYINIRILIVSQPNYLRSILIKIFYGTLKWFRVNIQLRSWGRRVAMSLRLV